MLGHLFILTGPSGVGKSTVEARVRELLPGFVKLVTYTTRAPRPHEHNGVHYHFVSEQQFQAMLDRQEFLEWATVYNHKYGNTKDSLLKALEQGHVMMVIDVQGAQTIQQQLPDRAHVTFIQPESLATLKKHLQARPNTDDQEIQARLSAAEAELTLAKRFDAVVTNKEGQIDKTVQAIVKIIQKVIQPR